VLLYLRLDGRLASYALACIPLYVFLAVVLVACIILAVVWRSTSFRQYRHAKKVGQSDEI